MILWSRIILVGCFLLQDIPARGLEHGIGGVTNILHILYKYTYYCKILILTLGQHITPHLSSASNQQKAISLTGEKEEI